MRARASAIEELRIGRHRRSPAARLLPASSAPDPRRPAARSRRSMPSRSAIASAKRSRILRAGVAAARPRARSGPHRARSACRRAASRARRPSAAALRPDTICPARNAAGRRGAKRSRSRRISSSARIALGRPERRDIPFRRLIVVDRDEGRLAAHGQAHVLRREIGIDLSRRAHRARAQASSENGA